MLSMQNRLRRFYSALAAIESLNGQVYHDDSVSRSEFPYLVWSEVSETTPFQIDNHKEEQPIQISVNFYTTTEFDPIVDDIQETLNSLEHVYWELASRQPFDPSFDNNNVITYSWNVEVV